MPRRDARLEAVARRLGAQAGTEMHRVCVGMDVVTPLHLAETVEQVVTEVVLVALRAERARVRRIVRRASVRAYASCVERSKDCAANEKYNNEVYYRALADGVGRLQDDILAALNNRT